MSNYLIDSNTNTCKTCNQVVTNCLTCNSNGNNTCVSCI